MLQRYCSKRCYSAMDIKYYILYIKIFYSGLLSVQLVHKRWLFVFSVFTSCCPLSFLQLSSPSFVFRQTQILLPVSPVPIMSPPPPSLSSINFLCWCLAGSGLDLVVCLSYTLRKKAKVTRTHTPSLRLSLKWLSERSAVTKVTVAALLVAALPHGERWLSTRGLYGCFNCWGQEQLTEPPQHICHTQPCAVTIMTADTGSFVLLCTPRWLRCSPDDATWMQAFHLLNISGSSQWENAELTVGRISDLLQKG